MRVLIGTEPHELPEGMTIAQLLAHLDLATAMVAVAVAREHVPRSQHDRVLHEGDDIEILAPMQGG